ncbi:MAG: type II toxin-antitoxin system death-on-curing family toxin [Gemmatimonadetes bacterium]|nr:type II toxin-antitoxin system death-on-curing family toxin [Gemmatimonadota bacterium]
MKEPRWVSVAHVLAIHADQIQAHGGAIGLRDRPLLESALQRPRTLLGYEPNTDLAALAAAHGFALARNHAFVDGNKRVAFQAMYLFLGLNGFHIDAPEAEVVTTIFGLASGELDEPTLAAWLRQHMAPR